MASQCCDRTSSSSSFSSSSSSCFSAAKRDTAAVSTALPQFNSSVRYSEQLACELETKEETAVEVEDHDDSLVCTISLPQTELRTRPAGGCNSQRAALASGRFDGTAVTTTKGRTDSEPRVLLLSFGPSDGWSEASRLQKTMGTKKHSAEGFRKENAMEKRESKEAYIWPFPSSEANWTIQWANPRPAITPVSTAAPDEGNLLCDISFNDFITRVAIPPPPPPTPPSLVAVETKMNVPTPPPLPDFEGRRRLNFRSAKPTDRLIHSLDPTISKDQKKYAGGVFPALKPSGDVQLSPSTIQRIQMEYAAVVSRGGSHQLNLYGPMTENDAAYVSLEEDFAKLVTPPPPPPHQMTKNGLEIQRPPVPPPPPPVSVGVSHPPLLLTLPPHPPPNRSSGRGHTLASPSFPNRRPPSATTPPGPHKVSGVEAMNGFDETRLRPSSAPHRNVDASSKDKTKDADNQKETTNANAAAAAAAAAAAMSLSHESLSNVSARVEANSFSTGVAIKQQTTYYSRTHNNSATLPRTAPPTPPPRLNSAIDSNSAMDKRPPRRVSFDECPVQIEGPGRRENCSPPSSNTKRSSRRDSCSNPPPPSSSNEESTTRKSRRNESATLPQSSSLSRLITAATSWVGCRQPHSETTAQIRPHAIRSSSSSAFQSIVKDSNEPSDAFVAEAGVGAGADSGRSVRSGSFGGGDASSANISVFSNFKSKLKSYWSPSMSKRKSFVQRSSIDQSSVVVSSSSSSSSSSSRRSSSIDVVDYAQENPDGNPYKTMVGPRRRSSSRNRMEVKVASVVVGLRPPAAAEDDDDAHDLDHLSSLKQNTQSTFNTFTGMPVS